MAREPVQGSTRRGRDHHVRVPGAESPGGSLQGRSVGFATGGVNMQKLESYMLDASFTSTQFYCDVAGHPEDTGGGEGARRTAILLPVGQDPRRLSGGSGTRRRLSGRARRAPAPIRFVSAVLSAAEQRHHRANRTSRFVHVLFADVHELVTGKSRTIESQRNAPETKSRLHARVVFPGA